MKKNIFCRVSLLLLITCGLLIGCEKNQPTHPTSTSVNKKYNQATTLHGTVGNNKGLTDSGIIKVTNIQHELIATATLQNTRNYHVEIPANTALPIILTFYPENSAPKTENWIAVVIHPSITKYDINSLTTEIAKKAMSLGGYTEATMRQAAESTVATPDRDKTTAGFRGDPTQHYGGWH